MISLGPPYGGPPPTLILTVGGSPRVPKKALTSAFLSAANAVSCFWTLSAPPGNVQQVWAFESVRTPVRTAGWGPVCSGLHRDRVMALLAALLTREFHDCSSADVVSHSPTSCHDSA